MTDILDRLRNQPFGTETSERNLMNAAANEIERLRAALVPFAQIEPADKAVFYWTVIGSPSRQHFTAHDLAFAREIITRK